MSVSRPFHVHQFIHDAIDEHLATTTTPARIASQPTKSAAATMPDFVCKAAATANRQGADLKKALDDPDTASVLSKLPHPIGWSRKSRADYVRNLLSTGKVSDASIGRVLRAIAKDVEAARSGSFDFATPDEYTGKRLVPCPTFEEMKRLRATGPGRDEIPCLESEFAFAYSANRNGG